MNATRPPPGVTGTNLVRPVVPRFRMVYGIEREVDGKPVALRARWGLQVLQGNASPIQTQLTHKALNHMLDALYKIDVDYLLAYPNTPRLYQSGIHYMEEPPGQEEWQDIPTVLRMGFGDCEDLASWLAAERTVKDKIPSRPVFISQGKRPDGANLYHIVVKRADGVTEDPSRVMGMR